MTNNIEQLRALVEAIEKADMGELVDIYIETSPALAAILEALESVDKDALDEALDCSYASDSGINCKDLNHAVILIKASQTLRKMMGE